MLNSPPYEGLADRSNEGHRASLRLYNVTLQGLSCSRSEIETWPWNRCIDGRAVPEIDDVSDSCETLFNRDHHGILNV